MISIAGPPPVDLISVHAEVGERRDSCERLIEKTYLLKIALAEQRRAEQDATRAGVPEDEIRVMVRETLA
jgi:hypothetical protein